MGRAVFIHGSLRLPSWEHRPARALGCSFVSARDPTALEYVRQAILNPKPAGLISTERVARRLFSTSIAWFTSSLQSEIIETIQQ